MSENSEPDGASALPAAGEAATGDVNSGATAKRSRPELSFEINGEVSGHASHLLVPDFVQLYTRGLKSTKMRDNAQRRSRFFHLTQLLRLTRGIPGATAEAGVFRGLSSFLTCHYLQREVSFFNGETHYMIDSFEGLSKPVEEDGERPAIRFGEGAFTSTSLERVRETMFDFPEVNILKGWIPDVFEELPDQKYRFVHVDVDIYEPTLASFRYFYPRLSVGGVILCDDFGPWTDSNWPGCIRAVNEFAAEIGQNYMLLDSGNVFFIKR